MLCSQRFRLTATLRPADGQVGGGDRGVGCTGVAVVVRARRAG
jgi:hypothetical protein